jgi:transcriptional regulator with XRE-family HTH domain
MATKLQAIRKLKGFTQKDLAEASGVSLRMVQHYEQGKYNFENVAVLVMLQFANALNCSLADLLEGDACAAAVKYDTKRRR